jgi:hypothetical protein
VLNRKASNPSEGTDMCRMGFFRDKRDGMLGKVQKELEGLVKNFVSELYINIVDITSFLDFCFK